jgi:hypothetical protein
MARTKSAPVDEIEDDSLELIEEDEAPAKPAKKAAAKKAGTPKSANEFGAAWLAGHVNDTLGTEYTPANIRVVLRKMATDGTLDRAVGEDRARYQFTGENDRTVKAVVKAIKDGAASNQKSDGIKAARAGKAKVAPVEDEIEESPAPRKRAAKAAAAPAEAPARATRKRASA